MRSLLKLFIQHVLKVTLIFSIVSIASILALDRLFGGYEFYLGMLVFIAPLVAWGESFMLVPKNLEWLMALPISKRKLVALHYITSIFASFSISLASIFVLITLTVVKADRKVTWEQAAKAAPNLKGQIELANYFSGLDIYAWMTAMLMLTMFHGLSMSVSRPTASKRLYYELWNHPSDLLRWSVRIGWIPVLGLMALFREYFLTPFGIFSMGAPVLLLIPVLNTSHVLAFAKNQRRIWLAATLLVALAEIGFLYQQAIGGTRSESFDRRVASVVFLGPLSGGLAKPDLARLLEGPIEADRIKELGAIYKTKFAEGKRVKLSVDKELDFDRAIQNKKTFQDQIAALALFDANELRLTHLRAFFAKLQPLLAECRCEYAGYELLNAQLSPEDAITLLESNLEVETQFGLLWARYHRSPILGPTIQRQMTRYPDRLKLNAARTQSILRGRIYGLEDWAKGMDSRKVSSENGFFDVDCQQWKPKAVTEIDDPAILNACIRTKAETGHAAEIESIGWFTLPLDPKEAIIVKRVFKFKQ